MTRIDRSRSTPEPHKPSRKGLSRDELSTALVAKAVAKDILTGQHPRVGRSLKRRVTREIPPRSGQTDLAAAKLFQNKSYKTRVAGRLNVSRNP